MGDGLSIGLDDTASQVGSSMENLLAAGSIPDGYAPFVPAVGPDAGGRRAATAGTTTVTFDIDVHGVSDLATARRVGEQIGEAASEALTRRGVVVTARLG